MENNNFKKALIRSSTIFVQCFDRVLGRLLMIVIGLSLTACSVVPTVIDPQPPYQESLELSAEKGWWYARFRLAWPEGEKPDWSKGTLIAGEVIAPVLSKYRSGIELWRFHRRAARDGHDHVFSFIFYSTAATADQIYQTINNNQGLQELKSNAVVIWTGFDNTANNSRPDISATSDPNWPKEIMKTWPVFIMGASQMWLDLVIGYAGQLEADLPPQQQYQKVQQRMTEVWQEHGRHAWFHHLSGLYAYQPLLMRY